MPPFFLNIVGGNIVHEAQSFRKKCNFFNNHTNRRIVCRLLIHSRYREKRGIKECLLLHVRYLLNSLFIGFGDNYVKHVMFLIKIRIKQIISWKIIGFDKEKMYDILLTKRDNLKSLSFALKINKDKWSIRFF